MAIFRLLLSLAILLDSFGMTNAEDPNAAAQTISLAIMKYAGALVVMVVSVYAAKLFLRLSGGIKITLGDRD